MIDECGEAILADLLVHYGVDVTDVLVPGSGLTPRKANALIRQLPMGSATVAHLRGGPQFRGWDAERYMTALLIDEISELTWVTVCANSSKKSQRPKRPKPYPRPERKVEKQNSFAVIAKRIAEQKRKRQAGG